MIENKTIGNIVSKISNAEKIVVKGLIEKKIETEPSLTDRFLGAIEYVFGENGFESQGYTINARTLRDRGRNAPEHEFGADFVSVLNINLPNYALSKGFLVQAKLAGKEEFQVTEKKDYPLQIRVPKYSTAKKPRLLIQCEQMLNITPHSYVFVYSEIGIYVVSALNLISITNDGLTREIYAKTVKQFYRDHFRCFAGDKALTAHDDDTLISCRNINFSKDAVLIQIQKQSQENKNRSRFSLVRI
jgi:hypothetical protein